jgi:hypothetical protein
LSAPRTGHTPCDASDIGRDMAEFLIVIGMIRAREHADDLVGTRENVG